MRRKHRGCACSGLVIEHDLPEHLCVDFNAPSSRTHWHRKLCWSSRGSSGARRVSEDAVSYGIQVCNVLHSAVELF